MPVLFFVALFGACGGPSQTTKQDQTPAPGQRPTEVGSEQKKAEPEDATELTVRQVIVPETPQYIEGIDKGAQDSFKEGVVAVYTAPPDFGVAVEKFSDAIEKDKQFLEAYFNLGMTYERMGEKEKALATYQDALTNNPDSLDAKGYVGKIFLAKARDSRIAGNDFEADQWTDKAKKLLDEVTVKEPDNVAANNSLALYWLGKDDTKVAEDYVKKVLSIEPRNVAALNTRGLINYMNKNYQIAKWIFEQKVLQTDPNSTEALTNLGLTYLAMNEKPRAVASFQKAIQLDPENVPARMNLAAIYLDYLNYAAAQDQYRLVIEQQPDNVEALLGFGTSSWGLQSYQDAVANYEKVLELSKKHNMLLERLGKIYEGPLSDTKTAVSYYKKYIAAENLPPTHVLAQKVQILENSNFEMPKQPESDPQQLDDQGNPIQAPSPDSPTTQEPPMDQPTGDAVAPPPQKEETPNSTDTNQADPVAPNAETAPVPSEQQPSE